MSLKIYFLLFLILLGLILGRTQTPTGGAVVNLTDYGYNAVILIIIKNEIFKVCGATIVNSAQVITTASCFTRTPLDVYEIKVRVGSIFFLKGGDIYDVSKVERHPEYIWYLDAHDLAIVYITQIIRFVEPREMPVDKTKYIMKVTDIQVSDHFVTAGERATVVGYSIKAARSKTSNLRDLHTTTMSFFPCFDTYRYTELIVNIVNEEILCLKNPVTDNFCDIFDGSPVVHDNKLVGIYNGVECNNTKSPLVFKRISNNIKWIQWHIGNARFHNPGMPGQCATE